MHMKSTIAKWGNSLGVRIPKDLVTDLGLKSGSSVQFTKVDGNILLSPNQPRYSIDDLVKGFSTKQRQKLIFPDDAPRGKEIW